jgi:hypothetical protein
MVRHGSDELRAVFVSTFMARVRSGQVGRLFPDLEQAK